jgi:transcription elongation factor Elf1
MYELAFNPDWSIVLAAIIIIWVITVFTFVYNYVSPRIVPPLIPPPRRHSLDNSPFKKLPLELVGYIATFLPRSAAASFTLTCNPIWFILGNQYLDQLWARKCEPSRRIFLKLLDRDLPYHVMCLHCNQLHRGDKKQHYSLLLSLCGKRQQCEVTDRKQEVHRYINPNFNYVSFQSIMKLTRSNNYQDYSNLLGCNMWFNCNTHVHQKKSYILPLKHRFLYRGQDWLRFRHQGCFIFTHKGCMHCGGSKDIVSTILLSLVVCPHLQHPLKKGATKTKFEAIMTCRARHWDNIWRNRTCSTCSGLHQCKICPTEFQLDTKDFGFFGKRLILTRWLDLGDGISSEDPKWTSHVGKEDHSQETPIPFQAGSIKGSFQKQDSPRFRFHLDNSLALLLGCNQPKKDI